MDDRFFSSWIYENEWYIFSIKNSKWKQLDPIELCIIGAIRTYQVLIRTSFVMHWLSREFGEWKKQMSQYTGADTVYPNKDARGFCFAVLCCGYTLTDVPISIRLTSLALWQSNDCPSASKATMMNLWIHYERLHNHNKVKHNKIVCIFLGIYCMPLLWLTHG